VVLWTGNGASSRSITGYGFRPDLLWSKARSVSRDHNLYDSVRGVGKLLYANSGSSEATNDGSGYISSFDTDGFTAVQGSGSIAFFNENSTTYAGWGWKGGGTAVTNTAGTISSQVSANTAAGISIVTYTSTTGTVGHGLGVAPSMIIMKGRNVTDQWVVGHKSYNGGSSAWNYGIGLNLDVSLQSNSGFWNNTAPASTVFSQGSWDNGNTKVAYCFAEVAGFSKFGSYTGNGSSDGTFVYCGFRPRYIMIKGTNTNHWNVKDTERSQSNVALANLFPNLANAETSEYDYDILSNGFKIRTTSTTVNSSGQEYVFAAFAEAPFNYSRAR
jgi:hypothetical protein